MHVLIVERDPFVRAWWQAQNEPIGAHLSFAATFNEARAMLAKGGPRPRCMVADTSSLLIDEQEGERLLRRLRSLNLPVLTYSSSSRWASLARILGARLGGCLDRPFRLTTALQRAFDAASSTRGERPRPPLPPAPARSLQPTG